MTRHIGSCKNLYGAIRKYLGRYEGKKISLLPFAKQTVTCHPELVSGSQNLMGNGPLSLTLSLKGRGNKAAFTLAEVLITLGIIGVVAALTMPSLIQKYNEQLTVVKVKKFYSVLTQAYSQAIQDNGTMDLWGLEETVVEIDDDGNRIYSEASLEQSEKFLKILDKYIQKITYQKLQKYNKRDFTNGYVLPDGTAITAVYIYGCLSSSNEKCADVYIRTQGKSNDETKSKYMFVFDIYKYRIIPRGFSTSDLSLCMNGKNYSSCTAWVVYKGNMDYLHCKDLSWQGNNKCK